MPNTEPVDRQRWAWRPSRRLWGLAVLLGLLALALLGGRHIARLILGGGNYLVIGYDALTQPGRRCEVRMKFERGSFLADVENMEVALRIGDHAPVHCRTNDKGIAQRLI